MSLALFLAKWVHADYPPSPVSLEQLEEVEHQLGVRFPESYRKAVLEVGLLSPTLALLDAIVERELDIHCLGDFYPPAEIGEQTLAWRELGMPEQLIAFAGDPMGNMFCFDRDRLRSGAADCGTIFFFDHDFGIVEPIAPNFNAWIDAFADVEPV